MGESYFSILGEKTATLCLRSLNPVVSMSRLPGKGALEPSADNPEGTGPEPNGAETGMTGMLPRRSIALTNTVILLFPSLANSFCKLDVYHSHRG